MISLLVPSRGRPDNIKRLWQSAVHTAEDPGGLELVVRLDLDDPMRNLYPCCHTYIVGDRIVLSEMWNECWQAARGPIFWHGGDDVTFNTPGWDRMVSEAFDRHPDGIAFVHGDDLGGKGDQLGTHGFVRHEWTDVVGTFTPPYFSSDYNDLWFNDVADALGRRVFLADVVTEHHHPAFEKAPWDQTHQDRVARHWADDVDGVWRDTADERALWVEMLRVAIRDAA